MGIAHKRDDFTRETFFDYWKDVHAPLSAKAPGLRGYVVSEVESILRGTLQADALVEQWFDSEEAFIASRESPEVAAAVADVPNYAKPAGTLWVVREHMFMPRP